MRTFKMVEPTSGFSSVTEAKKRLRRVMKQKRGETENRDLKESLAIDRFFASPYAEKGSFFVYLSFSSELPTDKLIERLLSENKRVYCPVINGKEMVAVAYGEDFSVSDFGTREPVGEAYHGPIDVVIAPLLAADKNGGRLGYGGGYYDRFLKSHPESVVLGWCYDFQVVQNVPQEEGDVPLSAIVTERETYVCHQANK